MPFQKGRAKTGGRKKGHPDNIVKEFKGLMQSILFDDPEVTREKLLTLRDSAEPADRRTFWGMAQRLIPQTVEGKIDVGLPTLLLDQDYVRGQTSERELPPNGLDADSEVEGHA